ncbi:hypothetical protein [Lentzea cavernae]|uniref:Uncharacterized protein n=1 Tax=Lentzea cavernae TaxID=2020703 RepID=A0ABQ3MSC0_9PSEU|nr:hypothetical protein [Lentzea cavernae]GHH57416.1 hypothetical protein GCM10017774_76870 [Lentzea cavernae]
MSAALVRTGVVTVCCGGHRPSGCCDKNCAPCCPECVTCPEVHLLTPAQRTLNAATAREQRALKVVEQWWAQTLAIRARADALVDNLAAYTATFIRVVDVFEPSGLAAARAVLADLDGGQT